jgi:hypothetical protein
MFSFLESLDNATIDEFEPMDKLKLLFFIAVKKTT